MFPPKINELLCELREQTLEERVKWTYNDDRALVQTTYKGNKISITYNFNESKELGEFFVRVINKNLKEYSFGADQEYERDYDLARKLYDIAQASDLDLDL